MNCLRLVTLTPRIRPGGPAANRPAYYTVRGSRIRVRWRRLHARDRAPASSQAELRAAR
jgi:hypothetical protein